MSRTNRRPVLADAEIQIMHCVNRCVPRAIYILPAELNEAKSVYCFAAGASFQTMTSVTPLRALPLLVKTMRNLSLVTGAKAAEFH